MWMLEGVAIHQYEGERFTIYLFETPPTSYKTYKWCSRMKSHIFVFSYDCWDYCGLKVFYNQKKKNPDKCSLLYQCSAVHSGCGSAGGDQVWMHCNLSFWMRVVFPRGKRTLSKPFLELQNQNNNVSQSPWSFIEHASHSASPRLWNTNGLEHKNRHRLCSGEALAKYGTHAIFKSFSDSDQRRAEGSWLLYFLSSHNCY